jgi:hypothetical protein
MAQVGCYGDDSTSLVGGGDSGHRIVVCALTCRDLPRFLRFDRLSFEWQGHVDGLALKGLDHEDVESVVTPH